MTNSKEMLGKEPVGKLLFKLALPTVVAQLINMLYNIVDRVYIGHMPGVRKFVLLLPLIYILPNIVENKTIGVYMAEPIADVIAVTFTTILFIFQFRKALKKIEQPQEVAVE